jgi:hypothetical protein
MTHYIAGGQGEMPKALVELKAKLCVVGSCAAREYGNSCGDAVWKDCPYIAEMVMAGATRFHDGWTGVQG